MSPGPDLDALDGARPVTLRRARVPLPFLAEPPAGAGPDRDGALLVDVALAGGRAGDHDTAHGIELGGRHLWPTSAPTSIPTRSRDPRAGRCCAKRAAPSRGASSSRPRRWWASTFTASPTPAPWPTSWPTRASG